MKNFAFEYEGKTLWYSRSVACSMYLFVYDRSTRAWYVLISKRGPGCPSCVHKWNVPGGYLDFDESLENAARRECWEETGIDYTGELTLASVSTNVHSKTQNVVCSFYGTMKVNDLREVQPNLENCELNEVEMAIWLPVQLLMNGKSQKDFAFGHDKMIREIFIKRININPIKRWLIEKIGKWTKINLNMQ